MNKRFWFCTIFCFLGLIARPILAHNAALYSSNLVITSQDSLSEDRSEIVPRHFEGLREKYADDAFIYERNSENSGWWARFKQSLSDFFKDLFDIQNRQEANNLTDLLLNIGGVIIFLLVVYFIFRAVMNNEGSWVLGKSSDRRLIQVTDIEKDLNSTDFEKLTSDAEHKDHYRLAVRYYYLWLLKNLSAVEIIKFDVEKTNSDYLNEIASPNVKDEFLYTSYLYNYIWYGEFAVDKNQYTKAKHAFVNFLNSLKA